MSYALVYGKLMGKLRAYGKICSVFLKCLYGSFFIVIFFLFFY